MATVSNSIRWKLDCFKKLHSFLHHLVREKKILASLMNLCMHFFCDLEN
jgi:hypothetical protein